MHTFTRRFVALCLVVLTASLHTASAATFNVTRTDDPEPGECLREDCSLREAVLAANDSPGADTIVLGTDTYHVERGALLINGGEVTIVGSGAAQTAVVATDPFNLFQLSSFPELTLRHMSLSSAPESNTDLVWMVAQSTLRLEHVDVLRGQIGMGSGDDMQLHVEDSVISSRVLCAGWTGLCRIVRSTLTGGLLLERGMALEFHGNTVMTDPDLGDMKIESNAQVKISDSTFAGPGIRFSHYVAPGSVPAVFVQRSRFTGLTRPISGNRQSTIHFQDCEFSENIGPAGSPAVLLATPGPLWAFSRSAFMYNLGGHLHGGAIQIPPRGVVWMDNVSFTDNSFKPDVLATGNARGRAIAVIGNPGQPAPKLRIDHGTLAVYQPVTLGQHQGQLLHVEGNAEVTLRNSILRTSNLSEACSFAWGGLISAAIGNIESHSGSSCNLPAGSNYSVTHAALNLAYLADNGGFTQSHLPGPTSAALGMADPVFCAALDQRGYPRPSPTDCDIGAVQRNGERIFAHGFE